MRKIRIISFIISLGVFIFWGGIVAAMNIDNLTVVAANEIKPGTSASQDMPMGQSGDGEISLLPEDAAQEMDDSDLFGLKGGYVHPYFTADFEFTDNLFNVANNETSNFLTRLSPGIWFSLPRTKEIPILIDPHNTSPGGLKHQLKDYEGTDRYQAYALGGVDYKMYSEDADLNDTDVRLEGLFRYNMRGGLSLQALDRYTISQDRFEVGASSAEQVRRYYSNILMGTAEYNLSEKLRLKADLSDFWVDYEETDDAWLDRQDDSINLYGYFIYSPKTSFFLQYKFTDVNYDSDTQKDSTQHYTYGGMTWDTTEKLALMLKAGWQRRAYEDSAVSEAYDWDGLTLDFQSLYRWTEKTKFQLDFYRRSEETDSALAIDRVTFGLNFLYSQEYTEKLSGTVNLFYEMSEYTQLVTTDRDDDRYYIRPALQYLFREWLMAELAYIFEQRESTDNLFDYTTNTVIFNINLAM